MLSALTYLHHNVSFGRRSAGPAEGILPLIIAAMIVALAIWAFNNLWLTWKETEAEIIGMDNIAAGGSQVEGLIVASNPAKPLMQAAVSLAMQEGQHTNCILHLKFLGDNARLSVSREFFSKVKVGMKIIVKYKRSRIWQKIKAVKIAGIIP